MKELNRVKNPRFSAADKSWTWIGGPAARWSLEPGGKDVSHPTMHVECADPAQSALWTQRVRCKAKQHYRVDAEVRADCRRQDTNCGFVLCVCFGAPGVPAPYELRSHPVTRATVTTIVRGYFQAPASGDVEFRVGLVRAAGSVRIEVVRLIPVLEPEVKGNVLALPPPACAYPAPKEVRRILLCSDSPPPLSLIELLRARFGQKSIELRSMRDVPASIRHDAVLIAGSVAPSALRTLQALEDLARDRIAVISLPAFARIARLKTRRIRQPDDPLNASVHCGCFITRGFALRDVFPFASFGDPPGAFAQNQFHSSRVIREFCDRRRYEVLLSAVTDNETTSGKPIALWKAADRGALIVCDFDALEAQYSTLDEANAAATLLLNALGVEQAVLGQYVTPPWTEVQLREQLTDLATHYPMLRLSGLDHSVDPITSARVRLGEESDYFGLPTPPRPTLLIRTGLRPGDEDGLYAVMLWLKRLVRPLPYLCPSTPRLIGRFRVEWHPLNRPWSYGGTGFQPVSRTGFQPVCEPAQVPGLSGPLGALIDITTGSTDSVRVVFPRGGALYERCARALPALAESTGRRRFIARAPDSGSPLGDVDARRWRLIDGRTEVVDNDPAPGDEALPPGVDWVRIETPAPWTDLTASSIWRTDLTACALDWTVGLLFGTMVTNHSAHPIDLDTKLVFDDSCQELALLAPGPQSAIVERRCALAPQELLRLDPGQAVVTLC